MPLTLQDDPLYSETYPATIQLLAAAASTSCPKNNAKKCLFFSRKYSDVFLFFFEFLPKASFALNTLRASCNNNLKLTT